MIDQDAAGVRSNQSTGWSLMWTAWINTAQSNKHAENTLCHALSVGHALINQMLLLGFEIYTHIVLGAVQCHIGIYFTQDCNFSFIGVE